MLYDLPVDPNRPLLPSPNELKRKIFVKAKKIQPITESIMAPVMQLVKQPSIPATTRHKIEPITSSNTIPKKLGHFQIDV
jgi:hypothetical protein